MKLNKNIFFLLLTIAFLSSYPLTAQEIVGNIDDKSLEEDIKTSENLEDSEEIEALDDIETSEGIELPEGIEVPQGMVYVPHGYFSMGSNDSLAEGEKPAHIVYLKDFFIDKYEVSNEEYEKFLRDTGYSVPKYWYDERFNKPNQPIVGVSWEDASAYTKWANKRLPTEAEWEKAARGTEGFIWPWGDDWNISYLPDFLNIYGTADNFEYTSPIDNFIFGISPFKVYNMAGNVWEWCQDWFDPQYYKHSPEINPAGPKAGTYKVLRGGSWVNKIYNVQTTKRIRNYPDVKLNIYGFRSARSIY